MTVSSEIDSVAYAGDGVTAIFPVPFYFLQDEHLRVSLVDTSTSIETPLVLNSDYTVSGAGSLAGGSVTIPSEPVVGQNVLILREVPATQEIDYVSNDPFPAESHERGLDKLTMLVQQSLSGLGKALRVQDFDPIPGRVPAVAQRANKLLGFDPAGNPIAVATTSGGISDADQVLWARSPLAASITTVHHALDGQAWNLWEFAYLVTDKPTPSNPATWDWAPALQGAILALETKALAAGNPRGLPSLDVPGGIYKLKSTITTHPWIKICSRGDVWFDFSGAANNVNGFVINNKFNWAIDDNVMFASHSPCLNGEDGPIMIIGTGSTVSSAKGVTVGNDVDGFAVVRDARLRNVFINQWADGIFFLPYDVYMFEADGCRIDNNLRNINTSIGATFNSGERMVFSKCVIAGSGIDGAGLVMQCTGYDMHFLSCSFDFNHDVLQFRAGAGFCFVNFQSCHFEGWDGFLVNADAAMSRAYVDIDASTILPTFYRVSTYNSASRPLVRRSIAADDGCQVNINDPIIRYTQKPYTEDPFLVLGNPGVGTGKQVRVRGFRPYALIPAGTAAIQANGDWNMQTNAIGTAIGSMTYWQQVTQSGAGLAAVADDGTGKKVLKITGNNTSSSVTFAGRVPVPVNAGDAVFVWSAISIKDLTAVGGGGSPGAQMKIDYLDAAGTLIGTATLFATYAFGTVFADSGAPNFAEGNARYIGSDCMPYTVPAGVHYIRPNIVFTGFQGDLYISRMGMWVQ